MNPRVYLAELAATAGLSLQAILSASNQAVAIAVGIATLLYIRAKTRAINSVSTAQNAQRPDSRS